MGKTADLERAKAIKLRATADALAKLDPADARKRRDEADLAEAYADLCDEWDAVRFNPDATRDQIKAAKGALIEMRRNWRAMGQLAGTRTGISIQNNTEG